MDNINKKIWPPLTNYSHVRDRVACEEDVKTGSAVFVIQDENGNLTGKPAVMDIPQYVFIHDAESGVRVAGVLIQAEHEPKQGAVTCGISSIVDDSLYVVISDEVELLGTIVPEDTP